MAQMTSFAVSLAELYDLYQVKGAREDLVVARDYAHEYRDATLRISALIRGEKDPVDEVVYGPIGSATYNANKHSQFTLQQARALTMSQHYQNSAQQKVTRALYAALGAAGVWYLDPMTTSATTPTGPVFPALGEYGAPLALGAMALAVYSFEDNRDGEFRHKVRSAARSRRDSWGLDPAE